MRYWKVLSKVLKGTVQGTKRYCPGCWKVLSKVLKGTVRYCPGYWKVLSKVSSQRNGEQQGIFKSSGRDCKEYQGYCNSKRGWLRKTWDTRAWNLCQGCTNPPGGGGQSTQVTKFCTLAPTIWRFSASDLLQRHLLASRILRWLLDFCKICEPLTLKTHKTRGYWDPKHRFVNSCFRIRKSKL